MKTIKFLFVAAMAMALSLTANAQSSTKKVESFKVAGNCEMCKARIEKNAKTAGVENAVWDGETKMLTIVYNPAKTKSNDVQKRIAAVGHDTPKFKATTAMYNSLPGCCKYR